MAVGGAEEEAVLDALGTEPPGAWRDEPEVGPLAQEAGDEVLVLGAVHGARGVDEPSPRAHEVRPLGEELALEGNELREDGGGLEEAQVGSTAEGAELGARGIHEDPVHGDAGRGHAEDMNVREPRAGTSPQEPIEPLGVRVIGQEPTLVLHGRAELERLASRASAEVQHGLARPGLHEQAEELAALVLDLEEALLEGRKAVEVGPGAFEHEGERAPEARAGLHSLGAKALGEPLTRGAERVHPERDGTGDIEVGAEVLGLGAPLLGEVVSEPIREGGSKGQGRRLTGGQFRRSLHPRERGRLGRGHSGEPVQEGIEEQRGRSIGPTQEVAEAAAPQADIEEGLLEGLALGAREVAMIPEGAIQNPLGGGASKDTREGLGGDRRKAGEGRPGLGA